LLISSPFIRLKWYDVRELRINPTAATNPDGVKPLKRLATLRRPKVFRCNVCLEREAKVWRKLTEDVWLRPLEHKAQMFGTM
jgi:hypothetical protein